MTEVIKEVLNRLPTVETITKTHASLMRIDPAYELMVKEAENHWLATANNVLKEIIEEIRSRITRPDTTVTELVKALDTISTKWNLSTGKPTSLDAKVTLIKELKDEDLDGRIKELEKHFVSASSHYIQVSQEESYVGTTPLIPSSDALPVKILEGEVKNE